MQNELGYAIWGLRAGTDHFLLKKNLVPEVENSLPNIRLMTQNHQKGNDFLYMADKTINYTILSIINTKTYDMEDRIAYIGISLFFENKYNLNTSGIPFLNKAMEFYLRTQTIAKAQNMFSDDMFIDQFQGLSLIHSNLFIPQRCQKSGFIKYRNISEIQEYFINSDIPVNYSKVLFLKEGNSITYLEKTFKEIKQGEAQELPTSPPEWPQMPPPPPSNWPKKIGIILISVAIIVTLAILSYKKHDNNQTIVSATDTTLQKDSVVDEDTPKGEETTPIDPVENPDDQQLMNGRKFHIVVKGENLSSIAEKHNLKLDELIKLNPPIKKESLINEGDTIWLEEKKTVKISEQKGGEQKLKVVEPQNECNSNCKKLKNEKESLSKDKTNQVLIDAVDDLNVKTQNCDCK